MVEHVLFLRHDQTEYLVEKRITGRSMEIPIIQKREIFWEGQIDWILTSPALRCRQTLELFSCSHPLPRVCMEPRLLERGMGIMEGKLRFEMVKTYPHLFHGQKFRIYETPPDGESFADFYARVMDLWEDIRQSRCGTVLICGHNQNLKMLSFVIQGTVPTQSEWEERSFPVGVVTKLF